MSDPTPPVSTAGPSISIEGRDARKTTETAIHFALLACAFVSVLVTAGIVGVLLFEALKFFGEVSLWEFCTGTLWRPTKGDFGVLPLLCGTLLVTGGAAIVAVPIGLGAAIYLSEYASPMTRDIVKPVLELLGGIPSVVYGVFAVLFISPVIKQVFPDAHFLNALSAGIVVGFMILPMVVSLSEDVLRSVPRSLREAAYALGATKLDVTVKVVFPAALSGIMASFLLAVSRAIGETMAVTLAAGQQANFTFNPLRTIETMTAYIVSVRQGDNETEITTSSIFAVGLALFFITMALNLAAQWILSRVRETYD